MSFSSNAREETAQAIPSGRQARETALAVLLANTARIRQDDAGTYVLQLLPGNPPALKKCFTLIQKTVNIRADCLEEIFMTAMETPGGRRPDCLPELPFWKEGGREDGKCSGEKDDGRAAFFNLLKKLRIIAEDGSVRRQDGTVVQVPVQTNAVRVFLREMFLCTGFLSDPEKQYNLEFRCLSEPQAAQLLQILGQQEITAGMTHRRKYFVVYVRDAESIVTLLHLIGASVSLMAMENARILKDVRNKVNRRVNCETANIGRTVQSAGRQQEDIAYLRRRGILETLPMQLRETALLREKYPGASLAELGTYADPPVGRSGMNHRLRKLSSIAQEARTKGFTDPSPTSPL